MSVRGDWFADRTVLITGASSGIGAEFARQFHLHGARLILVARRAQRLQETAADFNAARPGSARALPCDLVAADGVNSIIELVRQERIDILVNNAGRGSFGMFDELSIEREVELVALNIVAPLRLTHAVLAQMKARKSGSIINVASVAGFQPLACMATYAASKAFDLFHSLALHEECRRRGIRVLAVCPGPTESEFGAAAGVPAGAKVTYSDRTEDVVRAAITALRKGKSLVLPGLRAKGFAALCRVLPIVLRTRLAAKHLLGQKDQ